MRRRVGTDEQRQRSFGTKMGMLASGVSGTLVTRRVGQQIAAPGILPSWCISIILIAL